MKDIFKQIKYKTFFLLAIMVTIWSVIVIRIFFIQIVNGKEYQDLCKRQVENKIELKPKRGIIYDRNGKPLTINIDQYSIAAHPYLIKNKRQFAHKIADYLNSMPEKYLGKIQSSNTFVWLEKEISFDAINNLLENKEKFPEITISCMPKRYYPYQEICGQVIGFTNKDNKGLSGIEFEFDSYLSGQPGWKIAQKDGLGRLNNRPGFPFKNPVNGNDISLTIDIEYQTILQECLNSAFQKHNADGTMGIIVDPNNGEILAIASIPSFNPNNPSSNQLIYQKNRIVTDLFEPGSTFKIVTATTAIDQNIINPSDSIYCEKGHINIGKIVIHDYRNYETLSFADVIKKSSNIGTIKVAQKTGRNGIFNYVRKFGFGVKTGVQLPGEESGIVHPLSKWNDLMLAQVSIGHGVCCTTLQLAFAYSSIANGGFLLKPQLVKSIKSERGDLIYQGNNEIIRKVASDKTMATMRELLRLTVQSGTGINAEVRGMSIAGKTGTAQKVTENGYSETDYVATFVGFFPVNNPKLLCVVVIDNPKGKLHTGGAISAPVVREVFKRIINLSDNLFFHEKAITPPLKLVEGGSRKKSEEKSYQIEKHSTIPEVSISSVSYTTRMPSLIGKDSRQAVGILQRMGVKVKLNGGGIVVKQNPIAGTPIVSGMECELTLKPMGGVVD
jgi:cell division protein FtsI/penicillin-binding protein 2